MVRRWCGETVEEFFSLLVCEKMKKDGGFHLKREGEYGSYKRVVPTVSIKRFLCPFDPGGMSTGPFDPEEVHFWLYSPFSVISI